MAFKQQNIIRVSCIHIALLRIHHAPPFAFDSGKMVIFPKFSILFSAGVCESWCVWMFNFCWLDEKRCFSFLSRVAGRYLRRLKCSFIPHEFVWVYFRFAKFIRLPHLKPNGKKIIIAWFNHKIINTSRIRVTCWRLSSSFVSRHYSHRPRFSSAGICFPGNYFKTSLCVPVYAVLFIGLQKWHVYMSQSMKAIAVLMEQTTSLNIAQKYTLLKKFVLRSSVFTHKKKNINHFFVIARVPAFPELVLLVYHSDTLESDRTYFYKLSSFT